MLSCDACIRSFFFLRLPVEVGCNAHGVNIITPRSSVTGQQLAQHVYIPTLRPQHYLQLFAWSDQYRLHDLGNLSRALDKPAFAKTYKGSKIGSCNGKAQAGVEHGGLFEGLDEVSMHPSGFGFASRLGLGRSTPVRIPIS